MKLQTIKIKDLNEDIKDLLKGGNCSTSCLYLDRYAPYNIPFNTPLYMKKGKQLIAIKILMATYLNRIEDRKKFINERTLIDESGWYYLIQTPFSIEWRNDLEDSKVRFFHTKEEYFQHLESNNKGFNIKKDYIGNLINKTPFGSITFTEAYKWNGHCPTISTNPIKNIIINEQGITCILSKYGGEYWTKEDCIKVNINGLEVIDFPEFDNTIKVNIEVIQNKPIVRTINIIEE